MSKPNIVILSVYFPPKNHIASRRILAFADYLSEYFNVTVITHSEEKSYIENNKYKTIYLDNGFLDNFLILKDNDGFFKRSVKLLIRKTLVSFNKSFFFIWKKKSTNMMNEILDKENIDYILSSFMPIESHEVVFNVLNSNKKYDDIFWIADMRDEMSEHTTLNERQKLYYKSLEKKYSNRINLVTAVSAPILKQFEKNMSNVGNYLEIRNGYDHDVKTQHTYREKLYIGYFGNFYADRKPTNFFEALSKFNFLNDIVVVIASNNHNYNVPEKIKNNIKKLDFLLYEDSIKMMGEMDINLLILPYKMNGEGVYSGKLFDYISAGRPILGLINENDVAAKLIREYNCDYIADPSSVDAIYMQLDKIYNDWKEKLLKKPNSKMVEKLHRKEQVNILKNFLLSQVNKDNEG